MVSVNSLKGSISLLLHLQQYILTLVIIRNGYCSESNLAVDMACGQNVMQPFPTRSKLYKVSKHQQMIIPSAITPS